MSIPTPSPSRGLVDRITARPNRLGLAAAGLALLTAGFLVAWTLPVLDSFTATPTVDAAANAKGAEATVKLYAAALQKDVSQIDGRSFFFVPDPPPPPPPPHRDPPPPPPPETPKPPPLPTSYGGPKIIGVALDTVWFDNNKTMRVGGPLQDDMRVLSISTAPYTVRIEWKTVPFDVPFLPRDSTIIKGRPGVTPPPPEPAPTTPPVEPAPAAKPDAAKPDAPKPDATPGAPTPITDPAKPDAPGSTPPATPDPKGEPKPASPEPKPEKPAADAD